jgi:microcystin-dependent protein
MAQPYVGEIRMFAGNFAPVGWLFCGGQLLPIAENEVLFQLIGTTYGGDGQTTFALPDLRSRVPIHQGTGPSGNTRIIGEMGGVEAVTLTTQQIPAHSHPLHVSTAVANNSNPSGSVPGESPSVTLYLEESPSVAMNVSVIAAAGGSQPHTNVQPFQCVNFIISQFGIFPSQT